MAVTLLLERRFSTSVLLMFFLGALLTTIPAVGAEYFVSKAGNDAYAGEDRGRAFLTVQKGIDALEPGDTLTIAPGEYRENVLRANLGSMQVDTVIRAEIPGTVVLRGDVPAPEFKKVAGYRFVYAAHFAAEPQAVLEQATMKVLEKKPNVSELEFEPGSSFYDVGKKMLYISSADQRSPQGRLYSVAISKASGLKLDKPKRVIVEGISATGFYRKIARRPGYWMADFEWGIVLDQPTSCIVRDCNVFLNCGGIALNNGRDNVVAGCVAHDNIEFNIQFFGGDNHVNNVARNCRAYRSQWGIDSYMKFSGPMLMKNNVAWGHFKDYSTKGTDSEKFGFMERCVALGNIRINDVNMKNCVFAGPDNEYGRAGRYSPDNIIFSQEKDLDAKGEFADPVNMDWRLQGDSRFRRTGPGGKDRGLYPDHNYTIYFVSPDGNDKSDGTSLRKAWKTLSRAIKALKPGDMLYLTEGTYSVDAPVTVGKSEAEQLHIRAHGRGRVVINGVVSLRRSAEVQFERLAFGNTLATDCSNISFVNCSFSGLAVRATKGLRITHGLFHDGPLSLHDVADVFLTGNIYANASRPAVSLKGKTDILYSDYNSYQNGSNCWRVNGKVVPLKRLPQGCGRYSTVLMPEIVFDGDLPQVKNAELFAGRGLGGSSLGRHQEYQEAAVRVAGPFVHSVSDTTADIEWWTSGATICEVAWGQTPAMEHSATVLNKHKVSSVSEQTYRFNSFSLTGLKPGQKYYFTIRSVRSALGAASIAPQTAQVKVSRLVFTTAARLPRPKTYYVATDGNDANSGVSRDKAWRTVGYAASRVSAGDTVLVAGGTYREMVRLRASGAPGKPIVFRCAPGEKVVFDGDGRSLAQGIIVSGKKHIRLDGFYFTNYSGPVIAVFASKDVHVTRCFSDGRGPGYAGPLLIVRDSSDVTVRNCVSIDGFGEGIFVGNTHNLLVENNVFLRNLIFAMILDNAAGEKVVMRRNIFTDSLPFKSKVPNFEISKLVCLVEEENCYYMRWPDEKRKVFTFCGKDKYFGKPTRVSLGEYQKIVGDTGSVLANPWFKGTIGMKEGQMIRDRGEMYPVVLSDNLVRKVGLDFPDIFATAPEVTGKEIGLQPAAFKDFWFNKKK